MELWIRSQNKENLVQIDSLYIDQNEENKELYDILQGCILMGTYKTKERALEVLDEIQKLLTPNFNVNGSYQEVDLMLKSYLLNTQYGVIYEMPKE